MRRRIHAVPDRFPCDNCGLILTGAWHSAPYRFLAYERGRGVATDFVFCCEGCRLEFLREHGSYLRPARRLAREGEAI